MRESVVERMHRPKITVGISFHNPGAFFWTAIQSVFAQSLTDWELLLVDDGSTDRSLEIARSVEDARVRVLSDGHRRGLAIRLNQMVRLASSPYFVRMDADDIMHPDRLRRQYEQLLVSGPNTVIGTAAYSIDSQARVIGIRVGPETQAQGFSARHSFIHPTVAAATAWFLRHLYTEDPLFFRSEDAELWCRTTAVSRFVNLPEPLLFYREVGRFSFTEYVGTTLGVVCLLRSYSGAGRTEKIWLLTRELAKVWVTCSSEFLGVSGLVVATRYKRLRQAERDAAQTVLSAIREQCVPMAAQRIAG